MKGSLEGVLPMIGLLIMAIVLSIQSIPITEVINDAVTDSTSDIENIVNTRAYADFYFYNHVPLAAEYAWNEVSYNLGQNGGGETWNNSWLRDYSTNIGILEQNVDKYAGGNLSQTVTGSEGICDIPNSDYMIAAYPSKSPEDLEDEETKLYIQDDSSTQGPTGLPKPIETICNFGAKSYYKDDSLFYRTETNATNNRYIQLADETLNYFIELKNELNSEISTSYYGSDSKCQGSVSNMVDNAESQAEGVFQNDVDNAISEISIDYPKRDYFNKTAFREDVEWEKISEQTSNGRSSSCSCKTYHCTGDPGDWEGTPKSDPANCNGTHSCTHHRKAEASVEIEPENADVYWEIWDEEYKVITGEKYKSLNFIVDTYEHFW